MNEKQKKTARILGILAGNITIITVIYIIFWLFKYANGFENAVMFALTLILHYITKLTTK